MTFQPGQTDTMISAICSLTWIEKTCWTARWMFTSQRRVVRSVAIVSASTMPRALSAISHSEWVALQTKGHAEERSLRTCNGCARRSRRSHKHAKVGWPLVARLQNFSQLPKSVWSLGVLQTRFSHLE